MTSLIAQPQLLATAATEMAQINSAIGAAKAAAAGPTTGVVAAAQDEVSAATAKLFEGYAQEYQACLKQAASFHNQFAAALSSAGNTYAAAEAANASAISGAVARLTSPIQELLGASPFAPGPHPLASFTPPNVGFFMGGSGLPIPGQTYLNEVLNYVEGLVTPTSYQGLFTPEGLYPLTGIKDLTLAVSVQRGVEILDNTIQAQLLAGGSTSILGYSQSAIISSIEMQNLLGQLSPTPSQLGFTLIGDPMNPNGGVLARFAASMVNGVSVPGLTLPSLGIDFYGATPSNTQYPTNIYTLQYDGYADFPRYPINLLSDLNAFLGIETVHGTYPSIITGPINGANPIPGYTVTQLPTSPGYTGVTNYYIITNNSNTLPILAPLKDIPIIGTPLYDLLKPDVTDLVNLGYGNVNFGYSGYPGDNTFADQATPFGLFPHDTQLAQQLWSGAQQGFNAFSADIKAELPVASTSLASSLSPAGIEHALAGGTGGFSLPAGLASALASPNSFIQSLQTFNTNFTNAITSAAADSYAVLLPTADIANMLLTSVPAYDTNLFLSGIEQMVNGDFLGGLQYALVAPIAATTAMGTLAAGFELVVVLDGVESVIGDLEGI
jgi:hypothetical protein